MWTSGFCTIKSTPAHAAVDWGPPRGRFIFAAASETNREEKTRLPPLELARIFCNDSGHNEKAGHRRPIDMAEQDNNEFALELARLQQEHRDLDAAIGALQHSPAPDLLQLQRLKKRKLQLRDRIAFIEDQITPDIIA